MKEHVIKFLEWSRENPRKFAVLALCSHLVFAFYVSSIGYYSLPSPSPTEPRGFGYQSVYPRVREGDDHFRDQQYDASVTIYERALRDLRSLQEEFPERATAYRDAERVVQARLSLARSARTLAVLQSTSG